MALSERSKFAKKVASKLEELTAHKLRNSTSHYEFEIRMIEGKSGDYYLLVKLNTIVDRRFELPRGVHSNKYQTSQCCFTCGTCQRLHDPGCADS